MKYIYSIKNFTDLTPDQLRGIVPSHFSLREEGKQLVIVIEREGTIDEEQIYNEIQRECNRISFLTGIQLNPTLIRIERPDEPRRLNDEISVGLNGVEQLPSDLDRQQWTEILKIQLRLWQLAHLPNMPLSVQIMLLFQIIECSHPNIKCPKDCSGPLDPLCEAKLIRDWVSHQNKKMYSHMESYWGHLKIKEFLDPRNTIHQQIIPKLHEKVKTEAEKIICASITKKS